MPANLYWKADAVDPKLAAALKTLGDEYPVREGTGTPALVLAAGQPGRTLKVGRSGETYTVTYGTPADALRGVGTVLADLPADEKATVSETCPFTTLGIMLDCSRNAVMTVEHVKGWLRRLALMGYNMVMLYTEDTYKLPGEPFFGFLRGAYSAEELRELDDYADKLGIELIGCIQTLAHLEQIIKWNVYGHIKDTNTVMLAGEPATYDLVAKMIETYATNLRSRRLHIGMDEAWDLARGQYINRHGYRREFDVFNDHLAQVVAICKRFGVRPMIWSDMYFRLGSKDHNYYDLAAVIPDDVVKAIPPEVELVYWDYYHPTDETYLKMIEIHRQMKREPIMASGVWTWKHLWYGQGITERAGGACIRACRQAKLKEVFFTMWGDDGGYCEYDSALAGLAWAAEQAYGSDDLETLRDRYEAICGVDYDHTLLGSKLHDQTLGNRIDEVPVDFPVLVLWDDPLLGIHHLIMKARRGDFWKYASQHYHQVEDELSPHIGRTQPVDLDHALTLAKFLAAKVDFRMSLEDAYQARDRGRMQMLLPEVGRIVELLDQLHGTFRRQWHRHHKPFGFEVVQIRLAGLRERYREVARLVSELLYQQRDSIPELDEGLAAPKEALEKLRVPSNYDRLATASCIL
jgi:hexosaminidase